MSRWRSPWQARWAVTETIVSLGPRPWQRHRYDRLGAPGDLGWVIQRHGEVYAEEFGWDTTFEALVASIVAGYAAARDPAREAAWIAEAAGRRAGSVFCVAHDECVAKLRILLVDPAARGLGLGAALVDECVRFAAAAGYEELRLWTNHPLVAARRIYERAGFRVVEEQSQRSFGHDLVGQTFARRLG